MTRSTIFLKIVFKHHYERGKNGNLLNMKIPPTPPNYNKIIGELFQSNPEMANRLLTDSKPTDSKNRYLHWDKLQHLEPPKGWNTKQWWAGTKVARQQSYREISLLDKLKKPFVFATPDCVQRNQHWLDQNAAGNLSGDPQIADPQTGKTFLMRSLLNEAIDSSQLEGAATTRKVAKEMLRTGREPQDKSERMIYNNYHAMQFIREHKDDRLTPALVLELHKILTDQTLDDPGDAGMYRTTNDIHIVDFYNTVLHTPPTAAELPRRMEALCQFANDDNSKTFIHPIIRAILLHFMLAYDHPFVDGNGRTARALFYWSAANSGYWLMEYISISHIIKQAPHQYVEAFLHTETDDNDTTYFIVHQLDVIKKATDALTEYRAKKRKEIESTKKILEKSERLRKQLSHRQKALLKHALSHPGHIYKIKEHQQTHGLSYETARKDLLYMSDKLNLLTKLKIGKAFAFESPSDLQQRIEESR